MTPTPDRHWCSMPGTVAAHEAAPHVLPHARQSGLAARAVGRPPATSSTRFCRTLATPGPMDTPWPQAPTVTLPSALITREAAPRRSGTTVRPSV